MKRMTSQQRQKLARIIAAVVIIVMILSVAAPFAASFLNAV